MNTNSRLATKQENNVPLSVCIYFLGYIHLMFKHAILGTYFSSLGCLTRTVSLLDHALTECFLDKDITKLYEVMAHICKTLLSLAGSKSSYLLARSKHLEERYHLLSILVKNRRENMNLAQIKVLTF